MGQGRTENLNQPRMCGDTVVPLPLVRGLGKNGHNTSAAPAKVLRKMMSVEKAKCLKLGKKWHYVDKYGFDVEE